VQATAVRDSWHSLHTAGRKNRVPVDGSSRVPAPRSRRAGIVKVKEGEMRQVLEEILNDSAAALILLEHHSGMPVRDAIARGRVSRQ
jgi:hypothetical protein